jgi:hypothetical protein
MTILKRPQISLNVSIEYQYGLQTIRVFIHFLAIVHVEERGVVDQVSHPPKFPPLKDRQVLTGKEKSAPLSQIATSLRSSRLNC